MSIPIDNDIRESAVIEQDKNIVVTAGAGTGKTTLLVNRILHLLLGHKRFQTEESPIIRIAAMTFTEKAASDMKIRLMEELEKIVAVINGNASRETEKKGSEFLAHIRDTYHTTYREIERRAKKSLEDMDKALIGTIHSFAASILRLYPIESGVVPGFVVDEGDAFDELFDKEWTQWLERELNLTSPNADTWKTLLRRTGLESLGRLAKRLSGFTIPLDSLAKQADSKSSTTTHSRNEPLSTGRKPDTLSTQRPRTPRGNMPRDDCLALHEPDIQSFADSLLDKISKVIPHCEKPKNNLLSQLNDLSTLFHSLKKHGIGYPDISGYDLDKNPSEAKTGWTGLWFETARELVKECHVLLKKLNTVDDAFITTTLDIILPFAKAFRQTYLSRGYVSFDGLLTLTRDLLQNSKYRYIRDKFKNDLRTILVDEFQDTDPVQYEIVLFLSEASGHYSKDARKVRLEPGKLFIVGDPKQSIYAFRRADIAAYEQVVRQVCEQEEPLKLQENFRSHSGITDVINQLFDGRIMVERHGLQPCYIPIHANRPPKHPFQKVEIVLVSDQEGNNLGAAGSREAEAEWIARWITKHVDTGAVKDPSSVSGTRKVNYRDIALILRAFTQVKPYIEAFKRYGIPYIVEGEKYFYTTQEILDFINLLRIIENPHDTIALAGVLRSPFVGLTDREIYELRVNHLLDYRADISDEIPVFRGTKKEDKKPPPPPPCEGGDGEVKNPTTDLKKIVKQFYGLLRKLHSRAGILPVSQLITEIMNHTHIAGITARAWHGEQKLANVRKLYQMAYTMEQSDGVSLKTFIDRMNMRIKEAREEGESPLSDETLDIVKILSIHKSKGLEFPIVILGNLHGDVKNDAEELNTAVFDWSTSTTGIVIGRGNQHVRNLQSIAIEKKLNDRSWEEEKRILYVAMTRAKELLILTGSLREDNKSYMGLITQSIKDITNTRLGNEDINKVSLGDTGIFIEHFRFDGTHRPAKTPMEQEWNTDWASLVKTWKKRETALVEASQTPLFTAPSNMTGEETSTFDLTGKPVGVERTSDVHFNHAEIIGSICHQILQEWNFHGTPEELQKLAESITKGTITTEKNHVPDFIKAEVLRMLLHFMGSEAYKELQDAEILGRELPVLLKWDGQIMRGTIDILYKTDGNIIIADYKTDHVTADALSAKADKYKQQKKVYVEAVKRCLKIDNPEFKLIFLRLGKAIPI